MLLALVVAITLKRCKAEFLLVEVDDAPEKGELYCLNQVNYTIKSKHEKHFVKHDYKMIANLTY